MTIADFDYWYWQPSTTKDHVHYVWKCWRLYRSWNFVWFNESAELMYCFNKLSSLYLYYVNVQIYRSTDLILIVMLKT